MNLKNKLMDEQILELIKKPLFILVFSILGISMGLVFRSFGIVVFLFVMYFSALFSLSLQVKHNIFMKKFAKDRNLNYLETLDVSEITAKFFSNAKGGSKQIKNIISGTYNNHDFRIFNYSYRSGGKNSSTYDFTVCDIEIKNTQFPYIYLKSKKNIFDIEINFLNQTNVVEINLEKEYRDSFELFCSENYEIEVLQIFSHSLLEILKKNTRAINIEFSKNRIYFYEDDLLRKEPELDNLYVLMKNVVDHSGEVLHGLHDDFSAMHQFFKKDTEKI